MVEINCRARRSKERVRYQPNCWFIVLTFCSLSAFLFFSLGSLATAPQGVYHSCSRIEQNYYQISRSSFAVLHQWWSPGHGCHRCRRVDTSPPAFHVASVVRAGQSEQTARMPRRNVQSSLFCLSRCAAWSDDNQQREYGQRPRCPTFRSFACGCLQPTFSSVRKSAINMQVRS